jgi:DMSO/TMAO reductase YedYZ molybdopterin-dependent catalytic subunit
MECSGSDATYFHYFKGEGERPSRTKEGMILSASEWTGVPLAAVFNEAGLTAKSLYVRAEGNDQGVPPTAAPGTRPFYYDKGLPVEKALHPDTISPGRKTVSFWSICAAPQYDSSFPAGRATGRSSG